MVETKCPSCNEKPSFSSSYRYVFDTCYPAANEYVVFCDCNKDESQNESKLVSFAEKVGVDEAKKQCSAGGCRNFFLPRESSRKFCGDCKDKLMVRSRDFGFVLPKKTGCLQVNQTKGVMCHDVYIEGIFLPLPNPTVREGFEFDGVEAEGDINLLAALKSIHRNSLGTSIATAEFIHKLSESSNLTDTEIAWKVIQDYLGFKFEEVRSPDNQPDSCEGLKWVKVKDLKGSSGYSWRSRFGEKIIGKRAALFYPNSD